MRKAQKAQLLEIIQTLHEAQEAVKKYIGKNQTGTALSLLGECQQTVERMYGFIAENKGEDYPLLLSLEGYYKEIYLASEELSEAAHAGRAIKQLRKSLINVENCVKELSVRLEVVFLPYKASMWDSLESIWRAANADPDCDAYVVPIPYYDRNPDMSLGQCHYEGGQFPDDVPVVHYETYSLESRRPDMIYIHNPYDENNYVTSIDPRFYSERLKEYTTCLVYVPYYMFPKLPEANLIRTPALKNVDCIVVQNGRTRDVYMREAQKYRNLDKTRKLHILALGTPKTDKIYHVCQKGIPIPEQWAVLAQGRKRVFMNTNASLILNNNEKFIDNLGRIFQIFKRRGDVFVIWREHPLTNATLQAMRPGMLDAYDKLKSAFIESELGILDTNPEAYEAIYFSHCYFGAGGSLAPIYAVTGKPILLTAYNYPDNIADREAPLSSMLKQTEQSMYFSERYANFLDLFLDNLTLLMEYQDKRYEFLSQITDNIDGTVGLKIMDHMKALFY